MMKSIAVTMVLSLALAGTALAAAHRNPGAGWHRQGPGAPLSRLKAQLAVTPAQQSEWDGFTRALEAMRPRRTYPAPSATAGLVPAPKVFGQLAERAARRAESARRLATAADSLYKVLTSTQQAVFDTHLADMRMLRRHWHGRHNFRGRHEMSRNRRMPPQS